MKRLALIASALAVFAAIIVPTAAPAAVRSSCDGAWITSGSCTLPLAGARLDLFGNVGAGTDPYVLVRLTEATTGTLLLSCSASGNGSDARCEGHAGASLSFGLINMPTGVLLRCEVQGRTSGTFGCASYA